MATAPKQSTKATALGLGRGPRAPSQPALDAKTLETAVQVAALLTSRDGKAPGGDYLLRKCGQVHVNAVRAAKADPDEVATWACAEARRRSPALEHKAIVAQRIE